MQFGKGPWNWTGMMPEGENNALDNMGNKYRVHQQELANYPRWHLVYLYNHYEVAEIIIAPIRKSVGVGVVVLCVFFGIIVFFLIIKANASIIRQRKMEEALARIA